MPLSKSLTFVAAPQTSGNLTLVRRARLVARLEEQKKLFDDPNYVRRTTRLTRRDGETKQVERLQRVRPWWTHDSNGKVVMTVLHGSRPLEFEKGKGGILVGDPANLISVIDALIAAVRRGELDEIIGRHPMRPTNSSRKNAA